MKNTKSKVIIGKAEEVALLQYGVEKVPARVDTGAKTSAIWASDISEHDGLLHFVLFDKTSPFYTGTVHKTTQFERIIVASSIGAVQERYKVKFLIRLKGKKIRARFTLADRSEQTYPILLGRNVLYRKFIVDVEKGKSLYEEERQRSAYLQSMLKQKGEV